MKGPIASLSEGYQRGRMVSGLAVAGDAPIRGTVSVDRRSSGIWDNMPAVCLLMIFLSIQLHELEKEEGIIWGNTEECLQHSKPGEGDQNMNLCQLVVWALAIAELQTVSQALGQWKNRRPWKEGILAECAPRANMHQYVLGWYPAVCTSSPHCYCLFSIAAFLVLARLQTFLRTSILWKSNNSSFQWCKQHEFCFWLLHKPMPSLQCPAFSSLFFHHSGSVSLRWLICGLKEMVLIVKGSAVEGEKPILCYTLPWYTLQVQRGSWENQVLLF